LAVEDLAPFFLLTLPTLQSARMIAVLAVLRDLPFSFGTVQVLPGVRIGAREVRSP
jgi:hypothetical protein